MSMSISRESSRVYESSRCLTLKIALILALGWTGIGHPPALNAQDPGPGTKMAVPAPSPLSPQAAAVGPPPAEYLINPNDVLDIFVFDVPELSHGYSVSPSGDISIPLLPEPAHAAGLTPQQLARSLEEAFRQSGRLRRPEISVTLAKPSISSSVAVEGAVKSPQIVPAMGRTRLMDIITQCGGLTEDAGNAVTIVRGSFALADLARGGEPVVPTVSVDLKKLMDVGDPESKTSVWPGDRVILERQKPDVYYVLGEVKSPGGYSIKYGQDELTVLRAIALAGDITRFAKNDAVIIRKDPASPLGRKEVKLDIKGMLKGHTKDINMLAEDILFVPGSTSKRALHSLESAPAMLTTDAAVALLIR